MTRPPTAEADGDVVIDITTGTDTITESRSDEKVEPGDHDKFAHYVIGGSEAILRSAVTGEPVVALCGKIWVPNRSPRGFTVCPTCKEVQDQRDKGLIDP